MLAGLAATVLLAATACPMPTVPLPAHEPSRTPGPPELVSGLYVQGGALIQGCKPEPRGPYAGTLTVTSARSGRVVARRSLAVAGRLFVIRLAPGSYRLRARTSGGLEAVPQAVTIPSHRTVRQDVFVDVP